MNLNNILATFPRSAEFTFKIGHDSLIITLNLERRPNNYLQNPSPTVILYLRHGFRTEPQGTRQLFINAAGLASILGAPAGQYRGLSPFTPGCIPPQELYHTATTSHMWWDIDGVRRTMEQRRNMASNVEHESDGVRTINNMAGAAGLIQWIDEVDERIQGYAKQLELERAQERNELRMATAAAEAPELHQPATVEDRLLALIDEYKQRAYPALGPDASSKETLTQQRDRLRDFTMRQMLQRALDLECGRYHVAAAISFGTEARPRTLEEMLQALAKQTYTLENLQ
jgi:hypothetical protein